MTSPARPTVLIHEFVTGGGMAGEPLPDSWAREGAAMRRSLAADFVGGAVPSRVVVTIDPRLPRDHGPWETAEVDSIDRLEALAVETDYTLLIAPETGGVLEALTRRLGRRGCRLLGSEHDAVALAADKAALGERLAGLGVPTPRFRVVDAGGTAPDDWPYPSVVKPIDGAGSLETFLIEGPDEMAKPAGLGGRRLIQEYVPGVAMSATFLARDGRARLIAMGEQRIEVHDGRFRYGGGSLPRACPKADPFVRAALESIAGLRGMVGVDFIRDEERDRTIILEINPRPTTSCVGLAGVLSPGLLAQAWLASDVGEWERLMDRIDAEIAGAAAVHFDAEGRIWSTEETPEVARS